MFLIRLVDMEKEFVISLAILALWYVLFMTPFILITVSTIIAFIFLGMVPFVDWVIPAEIMFFGYIAAGAALIIFAKERGYYLGSPQLKRAHRQANAQAARVYNRRLARLDSHTKVYGRAASTDTRVKNSSASTLRV